MEWLANISVTYVLIISAVLFVARTILLKIDNPHARSARETVESILIAVVLVFLVIRPFVVQAFFIPSESMVGTLLINDRILVNKLVLRFHEPRHGDIVVFKAPPQATEDLLRPMMALQQGLSLSEDECRKNANLQIGTIAGAAGDMGEVKVTLKDYPAAEFSSVNTVCLVKPGTGGVVLPIEKKSGDGDSFTVKFIGVNNGQIAKELVGSEVRIAERDYIKRLMGLPGDTIEVKNGAVYRNGQKLNEPYIHLVPPPIPGVVPWDDAHPVIAYDMPPRKVPAGKVFVMGDNRNNSNDSHAWGFLPRNRILGKAMFIFWPITRMGFVR